MTSTTIIPEWVKEIEHSYDGDEIVKEKITQLAIAPGSVSQYSYTNVILRFKNRVYVGKQGQLREHMIQWLHDSPQSGHSRVQTTYYMLKLYFY